MNKKNIVLLLFVLLVAFITYYGYVSGHYSTDDYNIINIGYNEYSVVNNLKEGRPIMYLIDQLALKLNISYDIFIKLTVIFAIFITSVTVIVFFNIVNGYFKDDNLVKQIITLLISYTIFFNFTYTENLYFVESVVMALALLVYLISAKYLVNRKHMVLSMVLAIVGTFCYNGFQCAYITLICILSILKNKGKYKSIIKDILIAGFIIILSVALNFIQIKWTCSLYNMTNTRMGDLSVINIIKNVFKIIYRIPTILLYTVGLFPKYLYMIFTMSTFLFALIYATKNKNKKIIFDISLVIFVSVFSCFCVFIISLSSFGTGRLLYGIGMTIGLLFLTIKQYIPEKCNKIFNIALMIFFITNIANTIYLVDLHKEVNNIEQREISELDAYIKKYEEENNYIVKNITYIKSRTSNNLYYNKIKRNTVITQRALACKWSCEGVISLYMKRNLQQIPSTEEIIDYYNSINTEQNNGIVCYKDILICPISCW